jgi:hypothetical protein
VGFNSPPQPLLPSDTAQEEETTNLSFQLGVPFQSRKNELRTLKYFFRFEHAVFETYQDYSMYIVCAIYVTSCLTCKFVS